MIDTYQETGEKEWLEATVTIDGTTFERAGLRLKGNSSLRGVDDDADAQRPAVAGPARQVRRRPGLDGWTEFIVRSNSSETALNEAVALDLLAAAGLASEHAVASSFSVNGADARLRLVVQNLDEAWEAENFAIDRAALQGRGRRRLVLPRRRPRLLHRRLRPGDRRRRPHAAHRLPRLPQQQQRRGLRRRAARRTSTSSPSPATSPSRSSSTTSTTSTGRATTPTCATTLTSGGFTVVAWDHNLAFGGSPGAEARWCGAGRWRRRATRRDAVRQWPSGCRRAAARSGLEGGMPGRRRAGRRLQHPGRAIHRRRDVG